MTCIAFAPKFIAVSVPKNFTVGSSKTGVVLESPLLGCGGDGYGGAFLARGKRLPEASFFSGDGLR